MNQLKYILFAAILVFIAQACKEEKDCLDYNGNSGAIIDDFNMTECFSSLAISHILIRDTIEFKQLAGFTNDSLLIELGCSTNPALPEFDFDTYSLVGARTRAKGCIVGYRKNISIDQAKNIVQYTIEVHQCGNCNNLRQNMNWVKIEKVGQNDSLVIDISYY